MCISRLWPVRLGIENPVSFPMAQAEGSLFFSSTRFLLQPTPPELAVKCRGCKLL